MSISFDPKKPPADFQRTPDCPKGTPFEKHLFLMREGHLKETTSAQQYCEREWSLQHGSDPSRATATFMRACKKDHEFFQSLAAGFRIS